jgi:NADH-quinone oxidoreductase subunit G
MGLPGFDYESSTDVLKQLSGDGASNAYCVDPALLSNQTAALVDRSPSTVDPVVARIYALDGTVRRASSLQLTADAKSAGNVLESVA